MSTTVLTNTTAADLQTEPFSYVVSANALPGGLCDRLIAEYPPLEVLGVDLRKQNTRWSYPAYKAIDDPRIPEVWKQVLAAHVSEDFWQHLIERFAEPMLRTRPDLFPDLERLKSLRAGVRGRDSFNHKDVLLDAQISGNTPVTRAGSVRTTHVDGVNALFGGLLYLRDDADQSRGGDLELRRFKPGIDPATRRRRFRRATYVDDRWTEVVRTVPYKKNTVICFLNSVDSLHGVTPREPTPYPRLFMNLVVDINARVIDIPSLRKALGRMKRNVVRWATGAV